MSRPVAVVISDIHYSLNTLELADKATQMAVTKANQLRVPLVVTGDLHETKANLRGECVNAMIKTFRGCEIPAIILVGNHDKINERSDDNSLDFLKAYATIVDGTSKNLIPYWHFIPYQHDPDLFRKELKKLPPKSNVFIHQGVVQTNSGHYIQDKSAVTKGDLAGYRVISGHYHTRQSFELPDGGKFDYVGNPYTLNYGEANDPEKGFQILYDDGMLEFVPTKLRKHIIITLVLGPEWSAWGSEGKEVLDNDLVLVKMRGFREEILLWNKQRIAKELKLKDFRLDVSIVDDNKEVSNTKNLTKDALLDSLIDSLSATSDERKNRLKDKWKEVIND